jgi:hypothetical protein
MRALARFQTNCRELTNLRCICGLQGCCQSRIEAVSKDHYHCFTALVPYGGYYDWDMYECLTLALGAGNVAFVRRFLEATSPSTWEFYRNSAADHFEYLCIRKHDPASLRFTLGAVRGIDYDDLISCSVQLAEADCLSVLLERYGTLWEPRDLVMAAENNQLGILEVFLRHIDGSRHWNPNLPGHAAWRGHVRFLIRIFEAGCPVWTSAPLCVCVCVCVCVCESV